MVDSVQDDINGKFNLESARSIRGVEGKGRR